MFDGFPDGDLKFTGIPDMFFAQLLPDIDNLAELKITLHVMWLWQREKKRAVSLVELQGDETLLASLAIISKKPLDLLKAGLNQAVQRKTFLHAQHEGHDIYLLNSAGGRTYLEKIREKHFDVQIVTSAEKAPLPIKKRPNIFELYEANIGMISPILVDELKEAERTYPHDWLEKAFKIAAENNVRNWRYIRAVLENMATKGNDYAPTQRRRETDTKNRWFTDEEYEEYIKH
ncbi:MAG: hypothetical protein B6242_08930 [Anaerolineaceae bacterium 4572_78]|nr:MAG: hypothetical protein B6242_08930 [Anaerolineaceae bacterium 4572_78]